MATFLNFNRPVITTMLKGDNTGTLINEIKAAKEEGTDAFCFEIEIMKKECRTESDFKDIFSAMGDKPAYITNYRRGNVCEYEQSDEELTEEMLLALDCGATLFDIRGDLYDPCPLEITYDETAIKRQMKLVDTVHKMGKEVLMSTHTLKYMSEAEVLKIAKAQEARGVDIAKVVTAGETEGEEYSNLATTLKLREELKIPYLFLSIGANCKKHRLLGPSLGCSLFLSVAKGTDGGAQPPMEKAKEILTTLGYKNLP